MPAEIMADPVYVAPSTEPLTCLHIRDPEKPFSGVPGDGRTACDRELAHSEIWQVVERQPGDRVCPACLGEPEPEPDPESELGALF